VNAGRRRLVPQHKPRVRGVSGPATGSAVEAHREEDRCQEGDGDDRAANTGAGAVQHGSEYSARA
jgi:hypothetical protein